MASQTMTKYLKKVGAAPSAMRRCRRLLTKPRLKGTAQPVEPKWQPVKLALVVRLEAKPGKEDELASCLRAGLSPVQQEPATASWFALRFGPSTFAVFDTFTAEAGRQTYLKGLLAATIKKRFSELLVRPPVIEEVEVLAAKLADFG